MCFSMTIMERSQSCHKTFPTLSWKKKKRKKFSPSTFFPICGSQGSSLSVRWASRDKLVDTNKSRPNFVRRGTGPQMFQGQAASCCLSLEHSSLWAFIACLPPAAQCEMQPSSLTLLKKTEPSARAQGSGKRHTVFTQVLPTGRQSITVIPPWAPRRPTDCPDRGRFLTAADNTHGKHHQSFALTMVASFATLH